MNLALDPYPYPGNTQQAKNTATKKIHGSVRAIEKVAAASVQGYAQRIAYANAP